MTVKDNYQITTKEYVSMAELTADVNTMGTAGWSIISVNATSLRAVYRKDLP